MIVIICSIVGILISRRNRGQSLIREGRLAGGLHLRRDRHHLLNRWNPDFPTQPGTVPDSGGAAGGRAASPS
ncbi:MAG UNVERIFIED_CONTAM: hypothetical protein LVR18_06165 [Planctomycetaceae bacterium]